MKSIRLLQAIALSGALFAPVAYAADGTWTNLNGGSWTNAANWSGEVIAAGQDRLADFGALSLVSSAMVTLDGDQRVGRLQVDDAYGGGLNSWTFNAGNPGSSALTLDVSSGTPAVFVNMPNTGPSTRINAPLAGTAGLDKQGPGMLIIGNPADTLSGGVNVSQGVLSLLTNNLPLPNIKGITVASLAQLQLGVYLPIGATFTNGNAITLAGSGITGLANSDLYILGNSTTSYLTNHITLDGSATIGLNGATNVCHLQGGVSGTGPLGLYLNWGSGASSPATLELESPLTCTGDTTFRYTAAAALIRLHGDNQLPTGGALVMEGVQSAAGSQILALNGFNQTLGGLATSGAGVVTQHRVINSAATLATLTINDSSDRTFNGQLGGTGANENNFRVIKQGTGTWSVGVPNNGVAPTFNGGLHIQGGRILFGSGNPISATGWITIDPGAVLQTTQPVQVQPIAGITNNGGIYLGRAGETTLAYPIRGSGSLTNAAGPLTLSGTNTYTGSTVVLGGSLSLSTSRFLGGGDLILDDSLGAALALGVTNDVAGTTLTNANVTLGISSGAMTTLVFNLGLGNPTAPVIRVPGTFSPNGTVGVVLTGTALGAGRFTLITYGTLSGAGFAAFNPTVTTPAGLLATLVNDPTNKAIDVVLVATSTEVWNGNLTADWEGVLLNWTNRIAGTATNYTGTNVVRFDDGAMGFTAVNLSTVVTPLATTVSNTAKSYSFTSTGGYLSGNGSLTKQGTNKFTVATPNDYAGSTMVEAGSFVLGAAEVIPDGPGKGFLVLNGLLDLNGFSETVNNLSGGGVVTNSAGSTASLMVNGGATFSGAMRGAVDFTLISGGQTLSGSNGYTGTTKITGGTLTLANPAGRCLPGDVLMDGSTATGTLGLFMGSANQFSTNAIITMSSDFIAAHFLLNGFNQTVGGLVSTGAGGNRVADGGGILTINTPAGMTNEFSIGTVYVRDGTGKLGLVKTGAGTQIIGGWNNVSFSGGLLVSGGTMGFVNNVANNSVITNNATLMFDLPPPWGNARTLPIKGTGVITKQGGGPLWLQTTAAGSRFDVLAGALGGEGIITAPVTVASGAMLSPGYKADYEPNAIGQLSISNTLTLAEGSETVIEIDRTGGPYDTVVGLTRANFGGTLTVKNLSGTFTGGETYRLFSAVSYSGNFSATNLPALDAMNLDGNLRWSWNPSAGTLAVVSYSTTPTNIVAVLKGNTLDLSWPEDHTGWLLQAQTNSLSVGLGTNWSVWPGSATTNQVSIPVDAANGAVFFRLLMP
jgi:autotransporter-associated beta strand protein